MKKGVVIYYSFEGNTEFVSKALEKQLGYDLIRIEPKTEIKSKGFMKYLWGGAQVVMKKEPELKDYSFDIDNHTNIIFATPVWAGTFTPPLRSFFKVEADKIRGKNIAFVACHDGGLGKTFANFEKELDGNHFIGELPIEGAKKNRIETEKLIELWIKENF